MVHTGTVLPEWIDYNGHMNVAYYVLAFDWGVDALWADFGITEEHVEEHQSSTFAVESHVLYKQELKLDDPYVITSQILAFDEKRIHQFQRMYHAEEGWLAATLEGICMHIDMSVTRSAPFPDDILNRIDEMYQQHKDLPLPPQIGHKIGIVRKSS